MNRFAILVVTAFVSGTAGVVAPAVVAPLFAQSTSTEAAVLKTQSFAIKNMTCELCPLTVKKAMAAVKGVRSVNVDFKSKTATVAFDPAVTNTEAIAAASTNAGYPARPAG